MPLMSAINIVNKARLRRKLPVPGQRRLLREVAGVSQEEVGRAVGVTRAAVSRWEGGQRHPRDPRILSRYIEVLRALARDGLGVGVGQP
jgi:HTH-type transcriptional regulator/antitoxin MqsA